MTVIDAGGYIVLVDANEREHSSSWTWFEQARTKDESIVDPVILLSEVAAALSHGVADPAMAYRVVQQVARSEVIELIPDTLTVVERTALIASEHRIRGCDAVYVALAEQLSDALVTLDRHSMSGGRQLCLFARRRSWRRHAEKRD